MKLMRLTSVSSKNAVALSLLNGVQIMFSYETPVAAFVPGRGYLTTNVKYSRTTSKHINSYVAGRPTTAVSPNDLVNLLPVTPLNPLN